MAEATKIIKYHLIDMYHRDRGYFTHKVYDCKNKTEARKEAKKDGNVLSIHTIYKDKD